MALPVPDFSLAMDTRSDAGDPVLKRAKAGDLAAYEEIILRHQRQVFLTALRLLGRREDAQDAAQEVFVRLHKHLRKFDDARQLGPWLYRVTVNACRDVWRSRRRAEFVPLEEIASGGIDPHAELAGAERQRIVREGLKRLSEKERAALVLRDLEGLSTREVARALGSTETTVRSQISRARLRLKQFVGRFLARRS